MRIVTAAVQSLCSVFLLFALVGCDNESISKLPEGKYDGIVLSKTVSEVSQDFIQADLKKNKNQNISVALESRFSGRRWYIETSLKDESLNVTLRGAEAGQYDLLKRDNDCFESSAGQLNSLRLCFSPNEINLEINGQDGHSTRFIIDYVNKSDQPISENPRSFTDQEILKTAVQQSFLSQMEFDRVVQAKLTSRLNILNLLPHFSFNTYLNLSTPTIIDFFKAGGDAVPFLFPARWFKAGQAQALFEAELYAWSATKADAENIAEGLMQTEQMESEILSALQDNYNKVSLLRDQVREREKIGLVQIGTSDDVTTIMNSLQEAIEGHKLVLDNTLSGLAHSIGFYNPRSITGIVATRTSDTVDNPLPMDENQISQLALERSFELLGMTYLIQAAKSEKNGRIFAWLDPNPDSMGGMGFGFPTYLQIGDIQVEALTTKRREAQSALLARVHNAFQEIDMTQRVWKTANLDKDVQARRITRVVNNMKLGLNFSITDLVMSLESSIKADLNLVSARYQYLRARSTLDRLIYAGNYADFSRGSALEDEFKKEMDKCAF